MYQVGPWFVYLMNAAVLALVALGIVIGILRKRGEYARVSAGKILAEVWLPTGRSVYVLAPPTPDGWVHLRKLGDYRLAGEKHLCACGHDHSTHDLMQRGKSSEVYRGKCTVEGCECAKMETARVLPAIRRWGKYPSAPFLGIRTLQVDVRTESWYLNNPEPITAPENRTTVTAVDAQFHTRQTGAEAAAVEIQEQEARQKQLIDAISNQPHKMLVYVLLGGNIFVGIMILVQIFSRGG